MKKGVIFALVLLLMLVPFMGFSASKSAKWDSYLKPGNMVVSGGVGYGYSWTWSVGDLLTLGYTYSGFSGFGLYGGVEVILGQFKIANVVPLQFGVAGRASFTITYGSGLAGGGVGTLHLSFKGLNLPFDYLNNLDAYLGIGLGMTMGISAPLGLYSEYLRPAPFSLGFGSIVGSSYFFNDNVAIFVEEQYFATFWGSTIGVLVKM